MFKWMRLWELCYCKLQVVSVWCLASTTVRWGGGGDTDQRGNTFNASVSPDQWSRTSMCVGELGFSWDMMHTLAASMLTHARAQTHRLKSVLSWQDDEVVLQCVACIQKENRKFCLAAEGLGNRLCYLEPTSEAKVGTGLILSHLKKNLRNTQLHVISVSLQSSLIKNLLLNVTEQVCFLCNYLKKFIWTDTCRYRH